VVDYISNTSDVRELARSVLVSEFPDDEIIEEQKSAYSDIAVFTHKFDWASTDQEYPSIQKAETQLASIYVLEHYVPVEQREQVLGPIYQKVIDKLTWIKDNMPTETDETDILERTESRSWNLNHDLPFPSKLSSILRADSMMEGELL
jgi:hypothetical protein